MKSVHIVSLVVLASLAGAARADAGNYPGDFPMPSVDRAQVVAELREARANGQVPLTDGAYPPASQADATKTRAQVLAELKEAQRLGVATPRGDGEYPVAMAEQVRSIAEAGLRVRQLMASTAQ